MSETSAESVNSRVDELHQENESKKLLLQKLRKIDRLDTKMIQITDF